MEAKIKQEGGVEVIRLSGRMTLDTITQFQTVCLAKLSNKKVVMNMRELSFVGSNGIMIFLETLGQLAESKTSCVKLCGVRSEFLKIFAANNMDMVEVYEDERKALVSFTYPQNKIEFLSQEEEKLFKPNLENSFQESSVVQQKVELESEDEKKEGIYPDFSEQLRAGQVR